MAVLVGTLLTTINVCSNLGTIYNATQSLTINGLIAEYTTLKTLATALYTRDGNALRLLPSQITHILSLLYLIQGIRGLNDLCSSARTSTNKRIKNKIPKPLIPDIELSSVGSCNKEANSDNCFEDFVLIE